MFGRLVSFWDGGFSGAMLVSGSVLVTNGPSKPQNLATVFYPSVLPHIFPRKKKWNQKNWWDNVFHCPKVHLDKFSRCNFGVNTYRVPHSRVGNHWQCQVEQQVEKPKTKIISMEHICSTNNFAKWTVVFQPTILSCYVIASRRGTVTEQSLTEVAHRIHVWWYIWSTNFTIKTSTKWYQYT